MDLRGLQCPGPLLAVSECLAKLPTGSQVRVLASDPGFCPDVAAWCQKCGHTLHQAEASGDHYEALIEAGVAVAAAEPAAAAPGQTATGQTIVVFSGDLDRVLAAFVIANAGAAMGNQVTLFFTFWGLNALRRANPPSVQKGLLDRMFGWMMPCGAERLALSKMHMAGMGTAMMKHVMKSKQVASLPEMIEQAKARGVRLVACTMSMDVMGLKREELIDGIELAGAGGYLGAADQARINLFI